MDGTGPSTPVRRSPRFHPAHAVAPPAPISQRTYSRRHRRGPAVPTVHSSSSSDSDNSEVEANERFIARTLGRSPLVGYMQTPAWVRDIPSDDDFSDADGDGGGGPPTETPPLTVLTRLSVSAPSMPVDYDWASSSSSSSGDEDMAVPDIPAPRLPFSGGGGISSLHNGDDGDHHLHSFVALDIVPAQDHDPTEELGGSWVYVGPNRWRLRGPLSDVEVHGIQARLIGLHEPEVVVDNGGGDAPPTQSARRRPRRPESSPSASAAEASTGDDAPKEIPVCCACREDRVKTVFIACGHACLCLDCDEVLYTQKLGESQCPICNKPGDSIELFFS